VEVELFCREVAILHKGKVALAGKMQDLRAGKGYRLTIAAQAPESLLDELRSKAVSGASRDGLVDFQFATREQVNEAVDLVRAQRCDIEALTPTTSTLEEVFVRTVEK
jgi:ABC-type multidrug transport system ATPase subunit